MTVPTRIVWETTGPDVTLHPADGRITIGELELTPEVLAAIDEARAYRATTPTAPTAPLGARRVADAREPVPATPQRTVHRPSMTGV